MFCFSARTIAISCSNASSRLSFTIRYRYLIVNDNLELAFDQLTAIVRAEKQNTVRYFPEIEE